MEGPVSSSGGGGGGTPFSLTIEEQDGAPSVADVSTVKVTNGSLTDEGGGIVSLATGGGSGLYSAYIHIQDQKAIGTNGGDFNTGAWRTRTLTTELSDTGGDASLAANQITLQPGTYRCNIRCPAYNVQSSQARLQNVSDATTILIGSNAFSAAGAASSQGDSFIVGRFTLAEAKILEVQHQCGSTKAGNGFGVNAGFGTEVYTDVEFWKEL